ncbi:MAG: Asp-tRNA(Asn)/Glu-tRNA(Gln) amidotransferase subunit GatC [Oscillospiraceae bacterium]|nr:Asp-tRNA(Asn)/Glu-tRNA(Gln) amidotransferase subunit GatC [Oscillospiraceae bacterium]
MHIDEALIAYLENLSYLTFTQEEKPRLTEDLEKILASMAQLDAPGLEGVPGPGPPFDPVNAFRDDTVQPSFDRKLILSNAPRGGDTLFTAPKTVQ